MEKTIDERIGETLEKIRPFLHREGGDIAYVGFKKGVCYVSMLGACADCAAIDTTLREGIEIIILEEIPEVVQVELATPEILEKFKPKL